MSAGTMGDAIKCRCLAVEDEALDQVWGWKLAEVAT